METDFARSISVASVCRSRCAAPVPDRAAASAAHDLAYRDRGQTPVPADVVDSRCGGVPKPFAGMLRDHLTKRPTCGPPEEPSTRPGCFSVPAPASTSTPIDSTAYAKLGNNLLGRP